MKFRSLPLLYLAVPLLLMFFSCDKVERQKKAIAKEYAEQMTTAFMDEISKKSGENPKTKILESNFNEETETVTVKMRSEWMGNPRLIPSKKKELHELTGTLTVYSNGEKEYRVISKNEVVKRAEMRTGIFKGMLSGVKMIF